MTFAHPEYLRLGAIVAALILFGWLRYLRRSRRLANFLGGRAPARRLAGARLFRVPLERIVLLGGAALALSAAAADPTERTESAPAEPPPVRSTILALDISASMQATDFAPNRLAHATAAARGVIEMLPEERIGLLLFAGSEYALAPPTADHRALEYLLSGVTPTIASAHDPGSLLSVAIRESIALLTREGPLEPDSEPMILLFTDGEPGESERSVLDAAREAAAAGVTLHTIGLGTPGGSQVVIPAAPFQLGGRVLDAAGRPVVSRIEEPLLRRIAEIGGGSYIPGDDLAGLEQIRTRIGPPPAPPVPEPSAAPAIWERYDAGFWLAALSLLLLLIDSIFDVRLPRRARALRTQRVVWS